MTTNPPAAGAGSNPPVNPNKLIEPFDLELAGLAFGFRFDKRSTHAYVALHKVRGNTICPTQKVMLTEQQRKDGYAQIDVLTLNRTDAKQKEGDHDFVVYTENGDSTESSDVVRMRKPLFTQDIAELSKPTSSTKKTEPAVTQIPPATSSAAPAVTQVTLTPTEQMLKEFGKQILENQKNIGSTQTDIIGFKADLSEIKTGIGDLRPKACDPKAVVGHKKSKWYGEPTLIVFGILALVTLFLGYLHANQHLPYNTNTAVPAEPTTNTTTTTATTTQATPALEKGSTQAIVDEPQPTWRRKEVKKVEVVEPVAKPVPEEKVCNKKQPDEVKIVLVLLKDDYEEEGEEEDEASAEWQALVQTIVPNRRIEVVDNDNPYHQERYWPSGFNTNLVFDASCRIGNWSHGRSNGANAPHFKISRHNRQQPATHQSQYEHRSNQCLVIMNYRGVPISALGNSTTQYKPANTFNRQPRGRH